MRENRRKHIEGHLTDLNKTVILIQKGLQDNSWDTYKIIAMGSLISNVYHGYEIIFKTLLEQKNTRIIKGEHWHLELLEAAKKEGFIPNEIRKTMDGMLGFRHLQTHGYEFMLKEDKLRENSKDVVNSFPIFEKHIRDILEKEVS